jgi:hypothetical protein
MPVTLPCQEISGSRYMTKSRLERVASAGLFVKYHRLFADKLQEDLPQHTPPERETALSMPHPGGRAPKRFIQQMLNLVP